MLFTFVMLTHHGTLICKLSFSQFYFFFVSSGNNFSFSVKSSMAHITVLEWDQSGKYLLIGDGTGNAEMWTMLTHLLNEWTRVAHICIPDEAILAGIFFYNGKRVSEH